MKVFKKDPQAVLDYVVDWAAWLNGDSISSTSSVADVGLQVDTTSNSSSATTTWLSGGVIGTTYKVTNTISTAAGRTDERSFFVSIADK